MWLSHFLIFWKTTELQSDQNYLLCTCVPIKPVFLWLYVRLKGRTFIVQYINCLSVSACFVYVFSNKSTVGLPRFFYILIFFFDIYETLLQNENSMPFRFMKTAVKAEEKKYEYYQGVQKFNLFNVKGCMFPSTCKPGLARLI